MTRNTAGKLKLQFSRTQHEVFDQVIVAMGLRTENRLAQQAGLAFDRGIVVDPSSLQTSAEAIYALGDCISIDGEPCRFIEPILHQARTIAQKILQDEPQDYQHQKPVVRLKTRSLPIVIHGIPHPEKPWKTIVEDHNLLVMEQQVNGKVSAQLKLQKAKQSQAA